MTNSDFKQLLDILIEIAKDGEPETSTEELTEKELKYWYLRYGVDNLNDLRDAYLMDKYGRIAEETPDFSFAELKLKCIDQEILDKQAERDLPSSDVQDFPF